VPWREAGHAVPLLRYADDLLLTAADEESAKSADDLLRKLLLPAGMALKHSFEEAHRDIRARSAEWLGFRLRLRESGLRVRLGRLAFDRLGRRFLLAHSKERAVDRAAHVLGQWVAQLGPCWAWENVEEVCKQALLTAQAFGFAETLSLAELVENWEEASGRWERTRAAVARTPGYLEVGPLAYPAPTSVVW
jgi:hypothetical protein